MQKIGMDVDNVILDTASSILRGIERKCGRKFGMKEINTYNISDALNIDKNIVDIVIQEIMELNYIEAVFGSVSVLNWFGALCKPLYFISDRPKYLYHNTICQLNRIGLNIDYELILSDGNKPDVINKLGLDIFVEDKAETIIDIHNNTSCVIFVFDRPWNTNIAENDRICIVKNLNEFRRLIMESIWSIT